MTHMLARQDMASRLANFMKGDANALAMLQLMCQDKPSELAKNAEIWTGPFSSLRDDILGFDRPRETENRAIGIWEEDANSGDFVRSRKHIDLWRFCADVERISKKSDRKRIVFLGESVARGFFFSPLYGPAMVLERQLSESGEPVEVVDLAQSNCGSWWLTEMARAACALQPDAFVVFAGNNWRAGPLSGNTVEAFTDGALLSEDRGVATLMARQRTRACDIATATVRELARIAREAGVPLIFVVPEINLADWISCPSGTLDVPLMSNDDTARWIAAYTDAKRMLEAGDFTNAERNVLEAIRLDGSASSCSLELLARIRLEQSNSRDASSTLRQSRDVNDDTRVLPGIFEIVADTIRRVGNEENVKIVDLPRIFETYYRNEMPGRTQFLDYCHLTAEGIQIAMAATAQAIKEAMLHETVELDELKALAPSPMSEQEGWAHLLAGVHNAHWGQEPEICRYHFRRAVACHPPIANRGVQLLFDAFRHAAPSVLISGFGELVEHQIASTYLMGFGLISRGLINEFPMLEAMQAEFPELQDRPLDPDFALGLVQEIDLLHPHWAHLMDANRWFRRSFKAAYETNSVFPFVCADTEDLELRIDCRIPGAQETGNVIVDINGTEVGEVEVEGEWRAKTLLISKAILTRGTNRMTIRWPSVNRQDMRKRVREDFEAGQRADTRTHFGQLHDLTLAIASI